MYLVMKVKAFWETCEVFPLDLPVVAHTMMHDHRKSHFNDKFMSPIASLEGRRMFESTRANRRAFSFSHVTVS
jgi:hypothetical protein